MRIAFLDTAQRLWQDADKRRALLLSLTAHLGVLLTVVLLYRPPEFVAQPGYFVIEVGPPGGSSDTVLPSQDAEALEPQELGEAATAPEETAADALQASTPAPEPAQTAGEAAPPQAIAAPTPQPAASSAAPEEETPQELAEADVVDAVTELAPPQPEIADLGVVEDQVAEPLPAEPEAAASAAAIFEPAEAEIAAPLPARVVEAEPPSAELEPLPEPLVGPVLEPVLEPMAEPVAELVPEAVAEAIAPVAVLPEPSPLEVALPQVEVELATPLDLEVTPEVAVQVLPARSVELPLPQLEIAQPRDVLPAVAVELALPPEAEPVAVILPQPELEEAPAEVLAVEPDKPEVLEEVEATEVEEVPGAELALEPNVVEPSIAESNTAEPELLELEAAEAEALEPEVAGEAPNSTDVAEPPQLEAAPERAGEAEPERTAQDEPTEEIILGRADEPPSEASTEGAVDEPPAPAPPTQTPPGAVAELAPEPESGDSWAPRPAPTADAPAPSDAAPAEATAPEPDAPQAGGFIVRELPQEPAEAAVAPEPAEPQPGVAALPAPEARPAPELPPVVEEASSAEPEAQALPGTVMLDPYEDQRRRAIIAILDNADRSVGRQSGLREASLIYEMPVEGNLTRLMAVFDRADPHRLGPIRSARDYQHAVVEDLGGALVHVGGSPAALDAIARGRAPSFDALQGRFGELYSRAGDAEPPYNLYGDGLRIRDFLGVYATDMVERLRGTVYRPTPDLPDGGTVEVRYPGGYSSGFRFIRELNLYRWQRSGAAMVDAGGEAVVVQAVVVARVAGAPIPGDPEGRLYLALDQGGEATLFLGGKVIEGRWQQQGGFRFVAEDGQGVDLTPFKTWVAMVPSWVEVAGP